MVGAVRGRGSFQWAGKIPWRRAQYSYHSSILARRIPWTDQNILTNLKKHVFFLVRILLIFFFLGYVHLGRFRQKQVGKEEDESIGS